MSASKRYMNWTGVTFTPSGGSPIVLTGVTSVAFDPGGSLVKFSADGDRYNSTVVNDFNEPTATVTMADLGALAAVPIGTEGVLSAVHNDAKNGVGSGAITYTLAHAILAKKPIQGAHRQFGASTVVFESYAPDGITNPLSTSQAA